MSVFTSFGGILLLSALPLLVAAPFLVRAHPEFGAKRLLAAAAAGFAAVLPAALVQALLPPFDAAPAALAVRAFLIIAFTEEGAKFMALRSLRRVWRGEAQGFAAGTACGLGFAFIETLIRASVEPTAVLTRALTAVPLHAACGSWIGRAAVPDQTSATGFIALVALAVLVHGVYDLSLSIPAVPAVVPAMIAVSAFGLSVFARSENSHKAGDRY